MGIRENFKKGSVEMIILRLLSEKDMYGYEMTQLINERSHGAIQVPEGSLYPTLYRLIDNSYISDRRERVGKRQTRVYYHIEPTGLERLDEMRAEFAIFYDGLTGIMDYEEGETSE